MQPSKRQRVSGPLDLDYPRPFDSVRRFRPHPDQEEFSVEGSSIDDDEYSEQQEEDAGEGADMPSGEHEGGNAAEEDPDAQLQHKRALVDLKLKSRFEAIFEKYGKDFTGVGDEIDLNTGEIMVDNGHLVEMMDERDAGDLGNGRSMLRAFTVEPENIVRSIEDDSEDYEADQNGDVETQDEEDGIEDDIRPEDAEEDDMIFFQEDQHHYDQKRMPPPPPRRLPYGRPSRSKLSPAIAQPVKGKRPRNASLPSEDDILAQFGRQLGPQIAKYISQQTHLNDRAVDPIWQTPGPAIATPGKRPILKTIILNPGQEDERSPSPEESVWAPKLPVGRPPKINLLPSKLRGRNLTHGVGFPPRKEGVIRVVRNSKETRGNSPSHLSASLSMAAEIAHDYTPNTSALASADPHERHFRGSDTGTAGQKNMYDANISIPRGYQSDHDHGRHGQRASPTHHHDNLHLYEDGDASDNISQVWKTTVKIHGNHFSKRIEYTKEDDAYLREWALEKKRRGFPPGKTIWWKDLWHQLQEENPRHTWQSWLNRFRRVIMKKDVEIQETFSASKSTNRPDLSADNIDPQRSLNTDRRGDLTSSSASPAHRGRPVFSADDDKIIKEWAARAAQLSQPVPWQQVANENPHHSRRAWYDRARRLASSKAFEMLSEHAITERSQVGMDSEGESGTLITDYHSHGLPSRRADDVTETSAQQATGAIIDKDNNRMILRNEQRRRQHNRVLRVRVPARRDPSTISWTEAFECIEDVDPDLHAGLLQDSMVDESLRAPFRHAESSNLKRTMPTDHFTPSSENLALSSSVRRFSYPNAHQQLTAAVDDTSKNIEHVQSSHPSENAEIATHDLSGNKEMDAKVPIQTSVDPAYEFSDEEGNLPQRVTTARVKSAQLVPPDASAEIDIVPPHKATTTSKRELRLQASEDLPKPNGVLIARQSTMTSEEANPTVTHSNGRSSVQTSAVESLAKEQLFIRRVGEALDSGFSPENTLTSETAPQNSPRVHTTSEVITIDDEEQLPNIIAPPLPTPVTKQHHSSSTPSLKLPAPASSGLRRHKSFATPISGPRALYAAQSPLKNITTCPRSGTPASKQSKHHREVDDEDIDELSIDADDSPSLLSAMPVRIFSHSKTFSPSRRASSAIHDLSHATPTRIASKMLPQAASAHFQSHIPRSRSVALTSSAYRHSSVSHHGDLNTPSRSSLLAGRRNASASGV